MSVSPEEDSFKYWEDLERSTVVTEICLMTLFYKKYLREKQTRQKTSATITLSHGLELTLNCPGNIQLLPPGLEKQ